MNIVGAIVSLVAVITVAGVIIFTRGRTTEDRLTRRVERDANKADDLTKIEGIGPKIDSVLKIEGIKTFGDLAHTDVQKLRKIMQIHDLILTDPTTWPKQSELLVEGKLDELNQLQETLKH